MIIYFVYLFITENFTIVSFALLFHLCSEDTLECYYCHEAEGSPYCDSEYFGDPVSCQVTNPDEPYYGDLCYVQHNRKLHHLYCYLR